jgi:hypothetical protein
MMTVLTQTPAFVLGNGNEDYGHPGCPFDMRSEGLLRRVSLQTGASSHELMGDSSRNSAVVAGTFARAYDANRKAAVEGVIEADPENSWRKAAIGWELPRTFCVLLSLMMSRAKAGSQRIRASSPALPLALKTSA